MRLSFLKQSTDEELMQRAANGSDSAFEEIYRRYAQRLQGFFFRQLGGDGERAADMMQETFLKAYRARSSFKNGMSMSPWLFTIAYNLCRNAYRSEATEQAFLNNADRNEIEESDIEVNIDRAMLDGALKDILRTLPEDARMLFALRYEEELTIPQLAAICSLAEGTVKSRLHRIMNVIKQKLKIYETD
jgi:RNA polymerase sigma-70 factor (ECF subfamily)